MRKVGIVRDSRFLEHDPGPGHPESPARLEAIYQAMDKASLPGLVDVDTREAEFEELAWNHHPDYVKRIFNTASVERFQLDPDTATSRGSCTAARLAVGGLLNALELVDKGDIGSAFALVRPPGHHAEYDAAMGFCLFNNVAVAAHYARRVLGYRRVLIVDWDLHHGNGTQRSFYEDPAVLYFSTHQYPYYPGTGAVEELGRGEAKGKTVNVPLGAGAGDGDFIFIFKEILIPVANFFRPDLILVSAGFDVYEGDPLGGMRVTIDGFGRMAAVLLHLADSLCNGRIVFTLEGGYHLQGLAGGVVEVLKACSRDGRTWDAEDAPSPGVAAVVEQVKRVLGAYYPDLAQGYR